MKLIFWLMLAMIIILFILINLLTKRVTITEDELERYRVHINKTAREIRKDLNILNNKCTNCKGKGSRNLMNMDHEETWETCPNCKGAGYKKV